jgi:hypothetical protein
LAATPFPPIRAKLPRPWSQLSTFKALKIDTVFPHRCIHKPTPRPNGFDRVRQHDARKTATSHVRDFVHRPTAALRRERKDRSIRTELLPRCASPHILDREERYRRKWCIRATTGLYSCLWVAPLCLRLYLSFKLHYPSPLISSSLLDNQTINRSPSQVASILLYATLFACADPALGTALHLARPGSFSVASFPYWCCQLSRRTRCQWASSGTPTLTHPTDLRRVARDTLALSAPSSACTSTSAAAAETRHRALRRRLLALRPQEEDIRPSITTLTPSTTRASIRSGPQPLGKAPPLPRRASESTSLSLRRWKERGHKPHSQLRTPIHTFHITTRSLLLGMRRVLCFVMRRSAGAGGEYT